MELDLLTSISSSAEATRPVNIGALTNSWGPTPAIAGLRDGLIKLGYRHNENIYIGIRYTEGNGKALTAAAQDLIEAGAKLLFTDSNITAKAAQQTDTHIPIIFAGIEDPVGSGLVQSFARPGGNITGVASLDIELAPKRLQVFQELIPELKRVMFLYGTGDIYSLEMAKSYQTAARRLGIELIEKMVSTEEESQATLSRIQEYHIDGILAPRCCNLNIPSHILKMSTQMLIPAIYGTNSYWIKHGALASYGSDVYQSGLQSAHIVDKILKGQNPATIPVEFNSTVRLIINLKTAKTLRTEIPPAVLLHADDIVR